MTLDIQHGSSRLDTAGHSGTWPDAETCPREQLNASQSAPVRRTLFAVDDAPPLLAFADAARARGFDDPDRFARWCIVHGVVIHRIRRERFVTETALARVDARERRVWEIAAAGPVVYFVSAGDVGPIKIGSARCLRKRLQQLATGNHERLYVLAVEPGGRALERALHEEFAAHRRHHEWFEPATELLEYIEELRGGP